MTVNHLSQLIKQKGKKDESTQEEEYLTSVVNMNEYNLLPSGGTIATTMMILDRLTDPRKLFSPKTVDPYHCTLDGSVHPYQLALNLPLSIFRLELPWTATTTTTTTTKNGLKKKKKSFASPFPASLVNVEVIGWSMALRNDKRFTYRECTVDADFKSSFVNTFGMTILGTAIITGSLIKHLSPKPGSGPSMKNTINDYFLFICVQGKGSNGTKVEATLYIPEDRGYLCTAKMLVECGLALIANEEEEKEDDDGTYRHKKIQKIGGGFFSPGFALGDALIQRLINVGMYFESNVIVK